MRQAIFILFLLLCSTAKADPLLVTEDQTKLLQLSAPVSELILGNPGIADVTWMGEGVIAITGKTFGKTNLIVRDQAGNTILDANVYVEQADGPVVTLRKANSVTHYLCQGRCQTMVAQQMPFAPDMGNATDKRQKGVSTAGGGYPCDSETQIASDGSSCGKRSAWSRSGGREGSPPQAFRASFAD